MDTLGERSLARLAATQLGLVTSAQLATHHISREVLARRLASKIWRKVCRKVYLLSASEVTYEQRELAALFAAGDGAVLSHHSAARHLGLDTQHCSIIHITIPATRSVNRLLGTRIVRSTDLTAWDTVQQARVRVTSVVRTVLDIASDLDDDSLRVTLHSALRKDPYNFGRLMRELDEMPRPKPGHGRLRALLEELLEESDIPDSAFESLCMELGLATGRKPVWHHDVADGSKHIAELDFAWPEVRLGVELDSWLYHGSAEAFAQDRARDLDLVLAGWQVVRLTYADVRRDRQRVVNRLARAYELRARAQACSPPHLPADSPSG